jgi:hypothetical protein
MKADDVTDTLNLALQASGLDCIIRRWLPGTGTPEIGGSKRSSPD